MWTHILSLGIIFKVISAQVIWGEQTSCYSSEVFLQLLTWYWGHRKECKAEIFEISFRVCCHWKYHCWKVQYIFLKWRSYTNLVCFKVLFFTSSRFALVYFLVCPYSGHMLAAWTHSAFLTSVPKWLTKIEFFINMINYILIKKWYFPAERITNCVYLLYVLIYHSAMLLSASVHGQMLFCDLFFLEDFLALTLCIFFPFLQATYFLEDDPYSVIEPLGKFSVWRCSFVQNQAQQIKYSQNRNSNKRFN